MPTGARPNPPAFTLRLAFSGRYGPCTWANVIWVRNGGTANPSGGDLSSFASNMANSYHTHFMNLLSNALVLERVSVLNYSQLGETTGADFEGSLLGADSGASFPGNVAACVSWSLNQRYKGGHPRTYLCGIPISALQDAKSYKTTFIDSVRNAANAFHADVNAYNQGALGQLHLGTVSFILRKEWRNPPVFRDYIPAAAQVDARVDTQRRRLGPDV